MADALSTFTSLAREALEEVRSAILIADARADDLPIIYMNPAFEELTGYSKHEVLGRNCRFLQGPETDRTAVRSVKQGIEEDRPVRAILHNYRKDGSLFFNELFINPIRNANGVTTHLVGCQNAIASPKLAELQNKARDLIATLSCREKEVFEGLVRGETIKGIASQEDLSPRTVEKYRYRMQQKMKTNSLTMLVRYAIALGTEFHGSGCGEAPVPDAENSFRS